MRYNLGIYAMHPHRNKSWSPMSSRHNKRVWNGCHSISRWNPHQSDREMERRRKRMGK